jgi:hypothetical protein
MEKSIRNPVDIAGIADRYPAFRERRKVVILRDCYLYHIGNSIAEVDKSRGYSPFSVDTLKRVPALMLREIRPSGEAASRVHDNHSVTGNPALREGIRYCEPDNPLRNRVIPEKEVGVGEAEGVEV